MDHRVGIFDSLILEHVGLVFSSFGLGHISQLPYKISRYWLNHNVGNSPVKGHW